jgi:hypothetical protein
MGTLDATAFDYALKTRYSPEEVMNLTIDDQPFLAMVRKDTGFRGKNLVQAVKYADLPARSAGFSTAQGLKGSSLGKAFTLTRVSDYAIASIDNETMEASENDEGALLQALEDEMDSAIHALKRSMGIGMFGNGSGQLGSISSISTTTITLTSAEDAMNFEVGMSLVAATADTAAPKNSGTAGTVSAVDRDAGTVTTSADMTASGTAWAAADELFQEGDYTAASDRNKISGLKAWIPDSAPGATAFFGVNRSSDTVRLGGVRQSLSGLPLNEALVKLQTQVSKHGGRPKVVFISFSRMEQLLNLLGSKAEYTSFKVGEVGFDGVKVRGPKGVMEVYADINCPSAHAYALDMRIPCLHSLNAAPHILKYKGSGYFHEATSDGIEIRVGFYGNLSLAKAPGFCGVGTSFGS